MKKDLFKGIALGCALTICIGSAIAVNAEAIRKEIYAVYDNIRIVINGKEITPKDVNGNVVEPFVYEGTTYLPVRAISNALGEEVDWDGDTNTVYIGGKVSKEDVPMDTLKAFKGEEFKTDGELVHRAETIYPNNYLSTNILPNGGGTFILEGNYKKLSGMFIVKDGAATESTIQFKDADTNKILGEYTAKSGDKPLEINVDVTGVDKVSVVIDVQSYLYDAYLTPISAE